MKSKEEINKHLEEVGYTDFATGKIMGWMFGAGLKEKDEVIKVKKGLNDFEHFWAWVNGEIEEVDENVEMLFSLLSDTFKIAILNWKYIDKNMFQRKLQFLHDTIAEYASIDDEE